MLKGDRNWSRTCEKQETNSFMQTIFAKITMVVSISFNCLHELEDSIYVHLHVVKDQSFLCNLLQIV